MSDIGGYVFSVVLLPALVACFFALPVAMGPWRRRAWLVDAVIAFALLRSFTLSFVRELDLNALMRQITVIEGDDAPFEKWHRIGLIAVWLPLAGWASCAAHARTSTRRAAALGAIVLVATAMLITQSAVFPGSNMWWRAEQAVLVVLSVYAYSLGARSAAVWSAWVTFAVLAVLSMLSGFASLAVMCAAMSTGAFAIAVLCWFTARRNSAAVSIATGPAVALVLGALTAVVSDCGRAYDQTGVPAWAWIVAALLPAGGALSSRAIREHASTARATLLRLAGVLALAAVLVGALVASAPELLDSGSDDDYSDMGG